MKSFPFIIPSKMPRSNTPNMKTNNERVRDIACVTCKFQMRSNVYDPICGVCGHEMITVV